MNRRLVYGICTLIVLILEIGIALYVDDRFVRPYLGDLLATVLVYCGLQTLFFNSWRTMVLVAVIISYLVELLQAVHLTKTLGLEASTWARIVLGTSFSWVDMLMYTLAIPLIGFIEWLTERH